MNLKRILILAAIAFLAYYVLESPDSAASAFRAAGEVAVAGLKDLAAAISRFFVALFR